MSDRDRSTAANPCPPMLVQLTTDQLSTIIEGAVTRALSAVQHGDPLLSLKMAEQQYGVAQTTLRSAIRKGVVQATRGPRQRLLVAESELRRWLTACPARGHQIDTADDWNRAALEALQ